MPDSCPLQSIVNCTVRTCPLSCAQVEYVPTLAGNAVYAAAFSLLLIAQLGLGRQADVIVCSLPSADALLQVAAEIARSPRKRRIVVETSTLPIAAKEEARRILAASETVLLDCPLSGTGPQAKARDLVVYASGDRTEPLAELMPRLRAEGVLAVAPNGVLGDAEPVEKEPAIAPEDAEVPLIHACVTRRTP